MNKDKINRLTDKAYNQTHDALQTVYDVLNKGQRQKLVKNEAVKALFEQFDVEVEK